MKIQLQTKIQWYAKVLEKWQTKILQQPNFQVQTILHEAAITFGEYDHFVEHFANETIVQERTLVFWESAFPRLSYFVQCIESIWPIYIAEQTEKKRKIHHFFLFTSVSILVLFCQLKPVKFDSKCIRYVLMLWKNYEKN